MNRNIVGAVVGVQPFGGEGKSGTGPKAGGPLYLKRLQRNPEIKLGMPHTMHQSAVSPGDPAAPTQLLGELLAWAKTHGHENGSMMGERYLHATMIGTTLMLPGPTGERNELSFAPRGVVLCAAQRVDVLLNQLAAVLATNNMPVVDAATAALIPEGLPSSVRAAIRTRSRDLGATLPPEDGIGREFAGGTVALVAGLSRDGAIVHIIDTQAEFAIPLWRLVVERALCVNTTAAGGNASLMTLGN